jgi:hypothetical protein
MRALPLMRPVSHALATRVVAGRRPRRQQLNGTSDPGATATTAPAATASAAAASAAAAACCVLTGSLHVLVYGVMRAVEA